MRMNREDLKRSIPQALKNNDFIIYIQPQFNHSNKTLIGGEALVRWIHPENGMQSPADFIPIFEETKTIHILDLYVFEQVCKYQLNCIKNEEYLVPVSFNVSREDLYHEDYIEKMEEIRKKYDVPVKYLRVEITESSAIGGSEYVINIVKKLHEIGYLVEMDDFGSGYSSLNVLKDIPVDIIKLDLKFFSGEVGGRGGIIISSLVNMAKWLKTPIIAEGVETQTQADYMLSIGCEYIQGFFYSKPVPCDEFHKLVEQQAKGELVNNTKFIKHLDTERFWSPESLETLIFSNYVGSATIFSFDRDKNECEFLRINNKFLKEIDMMATEKEILNTDPLTRLSNEGKRIFLESLNKAIDTGNEVECELWIFFVSKLCGNQKMCLRLSIQVIGRMDDKYLFYIMNRNITKEKIQFESVSESEKKFRMASEQVNVYAWEYNIATKEMRPCLRCMRDLCLPPVVPNYPEPLFDMGLIPSDYIEMYRDWMKQLENGVKSLDGIIPLTSGRIPFRFRYLTEFDEEGKPIKAYGSAAMVEKNKM